jgi:hypothetical protein
MFKMTVLTQGDQALVDTANAAGGLGELQDKYKLLQDQMAQANALKGQQQPGGRMVGRMYAPASWAEHLNAAMGDVSGGIQAGRAQAQMNRNLEEQTQGRTAATQAQLQQQREQQALWAEILRNMVPRQPGQQPQQAQQSETTPVPALEET